MCTFTRHFLIVSLLVNTLISFSRCQTYPPDLTDIFDTCAEFKASDWRFPKEWDMFCFDNIEDLKKNATNGSKTNYSTLIPKDFNWNAFSSKGIWGFFNPKDPPALDLPTPEITSSLHAQYSSLTLTYYLYGHENDTVIIAANGFEEGLENECREKCEQKFITKKVVLNEDRYGGGAHNVRIILDTEPGHAFVFIDKIETERPIPLTRIPWHPSTITSDPDQSPVSDVSNPLNPADSTTPSKASVPTSTINFILGLSLSSMTVFTTILISQVTIKL